MQDFTQYDEQIDSEATALAVGNDVRDLRQSHSNDFRNGADLARVKFPRARPGNPLGTRYDRFRPLIARSGAPFTGRDISQNISAIAAMNVPIEQRMVSRDPEQNTETHDIPAQLNTVSVHTSVTHVDSAFNRDILESMFKHQTTRGFAF